MGETKPGQPIDDSMEPPPVEEYLILNLLYGRRGRRREMGCRERRELRRKRELFIDT